MYSERKIFLIFIESSDFRDSIISPLMKCTGIFPRVDILPKILILSHQAHILHRKQDEISSFRHMVEHLILIIPLLDAQIIMGQIRIAYHLFHRFFPKYRRMSKFHSMVMDRIFEIGSMWKIIVMRFGRSLPEQSQRVFTMSEGITNIRIWKSQKYSYNLSENPKI